MRKMAAGLKLESEQRSILKLRMWDGDKSMCCLHLLALPIVRLKQKSSS